ncbi:unnamed protein product [Effrenium voratum]|nr:unnamed protein product [Effrenium voratum]
MRRAAACFALLLALELAASMRVQERQERSNATSADPITGLVLGTVAALGSLYSLRKTKLLIRENEQQTAAALKLLAEATAVSQEHCQVLADIDAMLHQAELGLDELLAAEDSVRSACSNPRLPDIAVLVENQLQSECLETGRNHTAQQIACQRAAKLNLTCEVQPQQWEKRRTQAKLRRFRMDGVLAGWCDGVPGFRRRAPKVSEEQFFEDRLPVVQASLLQGQRIDPINAAGLAYSVLGIVDFAFDLHDTQVNQNQGFGILLDLVQQQHARRKQQLCQEATHLWLQVSRVYAWTMAVRADQYLRVGLDRSSPELADWGLKSNSVWVCNEAARCLVPAAEAVTAAGDGYDYPKDSKTCASESYFRVCEQGVAPTACFQPNFGKAHGRGSAFWSLTFRPSGAAWLSAGTGREASAWAAVQPFDAAECDKPLRAFKEARESLSLARQRMLDTCA